MKQKHFHFFLYNISKENNRYDNPSDFIQIIAEWDGRFYAHDGRPIVYIKPIINNADLRTVKDWGEILDDCEGIAEKHFAEFARAQKIAEARAVLMAENEPTGVPTLDRFLDSVMIVEGAKL